jgi:uncharacterized lipoprotein YehR (DUF1307 family)
MKKVTLSVFALSLVFLATGCGDSPDSLTKDTIKFMNDMSDVLEKIKSKEDAEKYKGDLEKLAKRAKDMEERGKKLKINDLPKEKLEELQKKYKDEMEKALARLKSAEKGVPADAKKVIQEMKLDTAKPGPF